MSKIENATLENAVKVLHSALAETGRNCRIGLVAGYAIGMVDTTKRAGRSAKSKVKAGSKIELAGTSAGNQSVREGSGYAMNLNVMYNPEYDTTSNSEVVTMTASEYASLLAKAKVK
jgi:hypothetical protein